MLSVGFSFAADFLDLGEVLLSVRTDLLGSASSNVVTHLPIVSTAKLSYGLNEPEMFGTSPSTNLLAFPVGFCFTGVLPSVISLCESHLDVLFIQHLLGFALIDLVVGVLLNTVRGCRNALQFNAIDTLILPSNAVYGKFVVLIL